MISQNPSSKDEEMKGGVKMEEGGGEDEGAFADVTVSTASVGCPRDCMKMSD